MNEEVNQFAQDQQFDLDEEPNFTLIDKYEKFPLYLEIEIKSNS